MASNQKSSAHVSSCSEQEFEKLLRRSELHFQSKHSPARKSRALTIVPPARLPGAAKR
jgi:hypothetical protein